MTSIYNKSIRSLPPRETLNALEFLLEVTSCGARATGHRRVCLHFCAGPPGCTSCGSSGSQPKKEMQGRSQL